MATIDDPKVQAAIDKAVGAVKKQAAKALKTHHTETVKAIKEHVKAAVENAKANGDKAAATSFKDHGASLVASLAEPDLEPFV